MADALIGYTGFVGSNLARQMRFDELYNRQNINDIRGRDLGLLVIASAPGAKWYANAHPREDWGSISQVIEAVRETKAERVVLISTVDVYLEPRGVDENTECTTRGLSHYGVNRLVFEIMLRQQFEALLSIIRLPALFGPGLKKNVLYDLMTNKRLTSIAPNAEFQWYPVEGVALEVQRAALWGEPLLNIVSEPIPTLAIRDAYFRNTPGGRENPTAPKYDVKSLYTHRWEAEAVMALMGKFIASGDIKREAA